MKTNSSLYKMTSCALMAALMCALCPLSVPIGPVPVSMSILVILITVYVLGTKGALISYSVYLLLGAMGMPVFSGFQGGLAKLAGPTGGYLIGFLPMILISGIFLKRHEDKWVMPVIGMVIGIAVDYLFGTAWFVVMMQCEVWYALTVCVFPFIAVDLGKILVASVFGQLIRRGLIRARLLPEI